MWISTIFQRIQIYDGMCVENFMKIISAFIERSILVTKITGKAKGHLRHMFFIPVLVTISIFDSLVTNAQDIPAITLKNEPFTFRSKEFYITGVDDERDEQNVVASLIATNATHPAITKSVDLKDGAAIAVKKFIDQNLAESKTQIPVLIRLKKFKLTESVLPNGNVSGKLSLGFAFDRIFKYNNINLVDYNSSISYNRSADQPSPAELIIRHGLENALIYFDKWAEAGANNNVKLAKSVKVDFIDYTENNEGDTIYYTVNRPLTWDDFKDKPRVSRFEAEIFTGIGYTEQAEVTNGVINIHIAIKTYLSKNDCWVKSGANDSYALNHEQRHFDISKIISERFKQKIAGMNLPVDNYDGPINVEYLESLREAYNLQKQYDAETQHGVNHYTQQLWDDKIDKQLNELGVKKANTRNL